MKQATQHQTRNRAIHIPADIKNLKHRSRDIGHFFGSISPWVLFAFIVVCYVLIIMAGYLIGHQRFLRGYRPPDTSLGTSVDVVLGLLAFMLSFTFSLTWSRFSQRNSLLIEQAKTLRSCYLRTSLLPEKQKLELRQLFQEYTNILVQIQATLDVEKSLGRLNEIHLLLWQQTASLAHEEMDSELRSLFTSSVNELINLAEERKTVGLVFRIPNAIWGSLLLLAFMGTLAYGYQSGISGFTQQLPLPLLPVAFGLVIVLIADLDSSGTQHRFRVTNKPLTEVLDLMKENIP